MNTVLIWLFLIGLGLINFFVFGFFDVCFHLLLRFSYSRHKRLRRQQRPSRIFLVRHGESQANVDTSRTISLFLKKLISFLELALYSRMADNQIELTEKGHEQAIEAGKKLRSIIGKESVYVYMSPYKRSKQTWANIRKAFSPLQVITEREDPRIREQEFGNLADLATQPKAFQERDRLGHFFLSFFVW